MDIEYYIDEEGDWCAELEGHFAIYNLATMCYIGSEVFLRSLKEPELYVLLYGN